MNTGWTGIDTRWSAAGAASVYNLRLPPKASGNATGPGPAPGFKGCRPCRRPRKRMWRSRGRSTTSILFFGGCRKQRIMQRHWIAQGGRHCSVKSDKNRSWGRFTSEMMMMTWFFQCKLWRKTHPAGRNNAKIEPQNSLTSLLKP